MPPIPFHGKEATADQANDEGRVSVNVEGLVRPGLDSLNGGAEFGNVVRQTGAYEAEDCMCAAWREPGGTSSAVGVAIVKGGAIRPDVLPVSRYATRASDGDRGGRSVLPEETGVSNVIPETVRPSKEGLGGVKQADAAQSVGHGWPSANA